MKTQNFVVLKEIKNYITTYVNKEAYCVKLYLR